MRLSFDSIEEVKEFVKGLKGTRGGKSDDGETEKAPAPLQPPQGGQSNAFTPAAFAPPAGGAGPAGGAFPAAGALVVAPEVQALATRIKARALDLAKAGQDQNAMLAWFRTECGPETSNYTMEQVLDNALVKCSVPKLENMAKLMAA